MSVTRLSKDKCLKYLPQGQTLLVIRIPLFWRPMSLTLLEITGGWTTMVGLQTRQVLPRLSVAVFAILLMHKEFWDVATKMEYSFTDDDMILFWNGFLGIVNVTIRIILCGQRHHSRWTPEIVRPKYLRFISQCTCLVYDRGFGFPIPSRSAVCSVEDDDERQQYTYSHR